jgi:glycine cleavage system transcriptional repressor
MAVLGGEFAAILLVSGNGTDIEAFFTKASAVGDSLGLRIEHKSTGPPAPDPSARPYLIESVSLDNPGIVHAVTSLLRNHNINIEDLETDTSAAPFTGAPMFLMRIRIAIPKGLSLTAVREDIDLLASKQDLDIKLTPVIPGQID